MLEGRAIGIGTGAGCRGRRIETGSAGKGYRNRDWCRVGSKIGQVQKSTADRIATDAEE